MVSLGGVGRIAQGLNLGKAPAIEKELETAANVATGGKLAMAKTVMNTASPVVGSIAQGAGLRIGWGGIGGIFNLLLNAARNMVPEFGSDAGYLGLYVWLIILVYWMSWVAGFAPSAVLRSHAILALVGFIIFLLIKGISLQSFRRYGVVFCVILIIDYLLLTGTIHWYLLLIAALLLAFREGNPAEDAKRVFLVMAVASIVYYVFNKLSYSLVLPFFAKLSLPLNFDNLLFFTAVFANRTVTFPFFWYAIFGLKETRVARSLAWFVMLLLIFAFWPQISPEVTKIRSQYAEGATAEQKAVIPTLFVRAGTGVRSLGASLGALISAKTASAYESAQETFGFGEPKQEPKLGLQLSQNSQMPKKVPDYKDPEPNFVMSVPNPFPADSKDPFIEVTEIKCKEKSGKALTFKKAITDEGITVTDLSGPTPKSEPVEVFYSGPRGGNEVKCLFEGWQSGEDYNIEAEVTYKVENSAYFSTTFMRSDILRGLRLKPDDPKAKAILDAIPPADAEYRNVPVTLTWGPRVLSNAPVPIDLNRESDNLAITVYVAKNTGWENAEIKSVTQLGLLLPKGVTLALGGSCDFVPSDADSGDGRKWYVVDPKKIAKDGKPMFIGDAIWFDCGMTVTDAALGKTEDSEGKDTAAARFDVSGSFEVTTKLEGITFTFGEGGGSGTAENDVQPTPQTAPALT